VALWQQLLFRSVIPALLVWVIGFVIHLPVGAKRRRQADRPGWQLGGRPIADFLTGYQRSSHR
jgi:hypothetical protein